MRKPEFVTFTGVDDRTDLDAALALSRRFPIEWGVLFSPTQQGRTERYPGLAKLREVQDASRERDARFAAHLCGEHSRRIMSAKQMPEIPAVLTGVYARVQVNHMTPQTMKIAAFQEACRVPCIGQFTIGPFPSNDKIAWLYDPSSGAGIIPSVWPRHPGKGRLLGYAGGIGPGVVSTIVERIDSDGPFWIDMETKVRANDGWLDLAKCEAVCVQVYG